MLTFESANNGNRLEIHGNTEGLLKLAEVLTQMAQEKNPEHRHLMTTDWGGSELDNEKQGLENKIHNHVKIFLKIGKPCHKST